MEPLLRATLGRIRSTGVATLARDLLWAGWRLARKAVVTAVPVGMHLEIAWLRGWLYRRFTKVPSHIRSNLESALGAERSADEIEQVARRHVEFLRRSYPIRIVPLLPGFGDRERWIVEGREHLDDALEEGRGVIMVSGHMGYMHMIVPVLRAHGYPMKKVVAAEGTGFQERKRELEEFFGAGSDLRRYVHERTKVRIHWEEDPDSICAALNIRPLVQALSENHVVLLAGDGMNASQLVRLPLLGNTYSFPTGFMKIAMRMRIPVLPVFAVDGNGRRSRIRIVIEPALPIDPQADAGENVRKFAEILDDRLRRAPHLWHYWNKEYDWFERAAREYEADAEKRLEESTPERAGAR